MTQVASREPSGFAPFPAAMRLPAPTPHPNPRTPVSTLDPDDPDLQDALELACLDAIRGDPPGPVVATRVQRACLDVLRAHGAENARVKVRSDRAGTFVQILLPAPSGVVRQVVLQVS